MNSNNRFSTNIHPWEASADVIINNLQLFIVRREIPRGKKKEKKKMKMKKVKDNDEERERDRERRELLQLM